MERYFPGGRCLLTSQGVRRVGHFDYSSFACAFHHGGRDRSGIDNEPEDSRDNNFFFLRCSNLHASAQLSIGPGHSKYYCFQVARLGNGVGWPFFVKSFLRPKGFEEFEGVKFDL